MFTTIWVNKTKIKTMMLMIISPSSYHKKKKKLTLLLFSNKKKKNINKQNLNNLLIFQIKNRIKSMKIHNKQSSKKYRKNNNNFKYQMILKRVLIFQTMIKIKNHLKNKIKIHYNQMIKTLLICFDLIVNKTYIM